MKPTNCSRYAKTFLKAAAIGALSLAVSSAFADEDDAKSSRLARFSPDHKSIAVEAPGIDELVFGTGVIFKVDGTRETLSSDRTPLLSSTGWTTVETPMGMAEATSATYGDVQKKFSYTITLKVLRDIQAIAVEGVFHNYSDRDAQLYRVESINTMAGGRIQLDSPEKWLVTPLMESAPAEPFQSMNRTLREAAMVYEPNGTGFLIGPTGPPEAFTDLDIKDGGIKSSANMDGVLVKAGQSRRGEPMMICFESPETASKIWTRWVAATHGARLHRERVYGWCSWYSRTTNIDETHTRDVLGVLANNPNVFGKGVLQLDDGYQVMDGDWRGGKKFPSGLAKLAEDIRAKGWVPGVWFAPLMMNPNHPFKKANPEAMQKNAQGIESFANPNPFHPDGSNWIVPDHPESQKFLHNIISDARKNGYGYIKIDFNGIGSQFTDPTKTSLQIFRELYALYREAAGEEIYILSCLGQPTRGVIGYVDAARVGPDAHPGHFDKCLKSVLRFQIYDKVWWANDPDCSYLAPKLTSRTVGYTHQGEGMWRTWHNIVTLVGGTAMNSEPLDAEDCKAVWRNSEIMRPSSSEPARLLTLGRSAENSIFGFSAARPYGNFAVWNLFNPGENPKAITLDFAAAGLPPGVECAVFDFWENKVIARAKDTYTSAPLATLSSALLRFTPLNSENPVLVGSNLHLSIGATEIKEIRTSPDRIEVVLTDAGAQNGNLIFHSTKPLTAEGAENCKIQAVESLGENLWRVDIEGRQWGKPQAIRLMIGSDQRTASK
jgi:hypothetical protein